MRVDKRKQGSKRKRKDQRTNADVENNANWTGCSFTDYKWFKNRKETKSRTYCAACPIPKGTKQCWLCVECEDDHRGRIRDALMST